VAAGWSSLRSFVASWPHRAPGWLLILFLSILTLLSYLDLFLNYGQLGGGDHRANSVYLYFASVNDVQWTWLLIIASFTILPSAFFVLIELFRDSRSRTKGQAENILEGISLSLLGLAWIPTVMVATAPGGAASLIGNSYFLTWLLIVFLLETFVWYVHDLRKEFHHSLREKSQAYQDHQRRVYERTKEIQKAAAAAAALSNQNSRHNTFNTGDAAGKGTNWSALDFSHHR
jgi:hypothetical protein